MEKCNDYAERLKNHRSYIEKLFEEKKQAVSRKYVTFGKSSVSSFTSVTGEEENLGASNVVELPKPNQDVRPKNSTPLETESSEKRNSEHLESQVTPKSTCKSYLDAEEAAHVEMRRKERQRESVEKRAELKRKKMQIEFERAQREYEERMKKLDEETQLQIMEAELGTLELSGDEKKPVKDGELSDDESLRDFETTEREMLQDDTPKKFPGKNLFAPEFVPEKFDSLSHQGRKELSSEMEDRYRNRSSSGDSNESLRRNRLRDFDYSARREERDYDASRRTGRDHLAYASQRNNTKLKLREFNGDQLQRPI